MLHLRLRQGSLHSARGAGAATTGPGSRSRTIRSPSERSETRRRPYGSVPTTRPKDFSPPSNGSVSQPDRLRRPRHGRRPRHREHARLRARSRHRALGAVRGRGRRAHRRGPRGRRRGEADARPHARDDPRHPAAEGRCDRGLRRHRGDAAPLHPARSPEPLRASARRRLRSLRRHRGREARRRGGLPLGGRPPGLPDRGADGGGDRRRACRSGSRPGAWSSTSAAAPARSP